MQGQSLWEKITDSETIRTSEAIWRLAGWGSRPVLGFVILSPLVTALKDVYQRPFLMWIFKEANLSTSAASNTCQIGRAHV